MLTNIIQNLTPSPCSLSRRCLNKRRCYVCFRNRECRQQHTYVADPSMSDCLPQCTGVPPDLQFLSLREYYGVLAVKVYETTVVPLLM